MALLDTLDLHGLVFVGHSVSSMIGLLTSIQRPDIEGLIDMLEFNMGVANFLAPVVMGGGEPADLTSELQASLCAADSYINRRLATATFLGDNRADLHRVTVPAPILQCADDAIAPLAVGDFLHARLAGSTLQRLDVVGQCPHMTHPLSPLPRFAVCCD